MAIHLSEKQKKEGLQVVKFGEIAKNISKRVNPCKKRIRANGTNPWRTDYLFTPCNLLLQKP